MRLRTAGAAGAVVCLLHAGPAPADAQERFRLGANAGWRATTTTVREEQTFEQYFEEGSFTFERRIPGRVVFDAGGQARVWRRLYVGASVAVFRDTGPATLEARVPHPLQFNRQRTTSGEIAGVRRYELAQHYLAGWVVPLRTDLDVMVSGGPSVFTTEQVFVTALSLSLARETFPFEELAFPGALTETQRETIVGGHAGADLTWRLNRRFGAGALVRYSYGRKAFTPTGGQPVQVRAGGLHASAGVRLAF